MAKRLSVNSVPALVGIVGPLVVIVGDITASLSVPGYSPIRDSVSSFALTSLGWLQSICFLAMGTLLVIFVGGLYFGIRRARGFRAGITLLALCGFVLMLIATFHMDHTGAPPIDGIIHTIASYGLGLLFPIAIFSLAPSFKSTPNWIDIFIYTLIAGVLAFGLIIGAIFGNQRGWFGLYERIIILNSLAWVEVVAIHCLRLLLKQESKLQSSKSGANGGE
jgi:chromate transport protein ChrA